MFLRSNLISGFERVIIHPIANAKSLAGVASKKMYFAELNPATLLSDYQNISFTNTPSEFGLIELKSNNLILNYSTNGKIYSGSIKKFGSDIYNESNYILSFSNLIEDNIAIGLNLNFNHLQIINYSSVIEPTFDFGFVMQLNDDVTAAFVASNLNIETLNKLENEIPMIVTWGIAYQYSDKGELCFDFVKSVSDDPEIIVGFEYEIHQQITIMGGINSARSFYSSGVKINWENLDFSFSINQHLILGSTNSFAISYNLQ
ncbi:MAG: hypothetical protein O3A55_07560 [Bacteroidetes bacterium]|nr:hypothetical protein [Bacteroidota bacterium]